MPEPTGPEWGEIRVTEIEDPLPEATFGSIGLYVEVTRPDGRDDAFIRQPLVLSFHEGQVEHVDPSSLRIFEVDVESRSFALLGNSAVDVEGGELFGWVDHPGVYRVIGLPQSPAVLGDASPVPAVPPSSQGGGGSWRAPRCRAGGRRRRTH